MSSQAQSTDESCSLPLNPIDQVAPQGRKDNQVVPLRILARRRDQYWYAHCLDLNLMTRRSSLDEALAALNEQIELYLSRAVESADWKSRVPRPAPLSAWLLYYGSSVLGILQSEATPSTPRATFRMPFDRHGHLIGA